MCRLDAVMKEVLRVVSAAMNFRGATEDVEFTTHDNKRYKIRKGDRVVVFSQLQHLDPDVYEEPKVITLSIANTLPSLVFETKSRCANQAEQLI